MADRNKRLEKKPGKTGNIKNLPEKIRTVLARARFNT